MSDLESEGSDQDDYTKKDTITKAGMLAEDSDEPDDLDAEAESIGLPDISSLEGSHQNTATNMPDIGHAGPLLPDMSDDEDEDSDDEDSFQKFDNELKRNYLEQVHPESFSHNYDEIAALMRVVRDGNGVVIDELHQTVPWLTKFERTRILGQRVKQLNTGATPFVNAPPNVIDNAIIAQMELEQKRIPFIVRRPIPGGGSEYWRLKDLALI